MFKSIKNFLGIYEHSIKWNVEMAPSPAVRKFIQVANNRLASHGVDGFAKCGFTIDIDPSTIIVKWNGDKRIYIYEDGNRIYISINGNRTWVKWELF